MPRPKTEVTKRIVRATAAAPPEVVGRGGSRQERGRPAREFALMRWDFPNLAVPPTAVGRERRAPTTSGGARRAVSAEVVGGGEPGWPPAFTGARRLRRFPVRLQHRVRSRRSASHAGAAFKTLCEKCNRRGGKAEETPTHCGEIRLLTSAATFLTPAPNAAPAWPPVKSQSTALPGGDPADNTESGRRRAPVPPTA